MNSIEDAIRACRETRQFAALALSKCLPMLFQYEEALSEAMLRDRWLALLRESEAIFPNGWYNPPPDGLSVIFGNRQSRRGYTFKSLRPMEMWPQDVFFDREAGFLHVYASPVHLTGTIGDLGMTIYVGNDQKIKSHLQQCWLLNQEIFDFIEVGVPFSEAYQFALGRMHAYNLSNDIMTRDGATNIGHTIPVFSLEERQRLQTGSWPHLSSMIGAKRTFVGAGERTIYQPGMMVTLEPRPTADDTTIPMAWFHSIIIIHQDGTKEILTDFDDIFQSTGMDYMLGL
jgi:hypothetical protein